MNPLLQRLDEIDGPRPDELRRIRRRLAVQRPGTPALLARAGVAVAAAALLLLALPPPDPLPPPAAPLAAALSAAGTLELTGDIRLTVDGLGTVSGDTSDVDIDWRQGSLAVSVTPEQGIDLTVRTDEASIAVVGTVFRVERSALGTAVSVERGSVSVECADMTRHRISAGDTALCLPRAALGRALTLLESQAPPEEILTEIQRGLRLNPSRAVRGELLSLQAEVHLQQGDRAAAAAVAWRYLHEGHTTRADALSPLAREAYP